MLVRTAEPGDVPAIVEVYLESWRAAYADLLPADVVETQAEARRGHHDWFDGISSPTSEVAIAVDGDKVVGVVQAADPPGAERDLPEITMLYVTPAAWGGMVARLLLAAGSRWIAHRGHGSARLRVVEAQTRARRFYEREGWRVDSLMPVAHNGYFPLVYYRRELIVSS